MTSRTKLDRLKQLYQHFGMTRAVKRVSALQSQHLEFVDARNAIAHSACAGHRISDPDRIVFAPVKGAKGKVGHMIVHQIYMEAMVRAAKFASDAASILTPITEPLVALPSTRPPEPPEFPSWTRPIRQKTKRNKPPRQQRGRRE